MFSFEKGGGKKAIPLKVFRPCQPQGRKVKGLPGDKQRAGTLGSDTASPRVLVALGLQEGLECYSPWGCKESLKARVVSSE